MGKKYLFPIILFAMICSAAASSLPELGKFSVFGNVKAVPVTEDGKSCLKVTLGGINTSKGGALQWNETAIKTAMTPDCDSITINYKGDGGTGSFVVVVQDRERNTWCWNGARWQASAMIPCYNDAWMKKVLRVNEFRYIGPDKDNSPELQLQKLSLLQIAIGMELKEPELKHAEFYLESIKFEHGAQEKNTAVTLQEIPSQPAANKPLPGSEKKPIETTVSEYALPSWVDWNLKNHYQQNNRIRHSVSLNNYWQFQPVADAAVAKVLQNNGEAPAFPLTPPSGGEWYYVKVPGRWDGRGFFMLDQQKKHVTQIDGKIPAEYMQAWFRRAIDIPKDWKDQRFLLKFNAIGEQARIFVNGVPVQDITRTGTVDVTEKILPGKTNQIAVFVQYSSFPLKKSHEKYAEFIRPDMGAAWWFRWNDGPGLTDNVQLQVIPAELFGNDLRILTFFDGKRISADANISNRSGKTQSVIAKASVVDSNRTVRQLPPREFTIQNGETKRIELAGTWENPICWSPENPKLYSLDFRLEDTSGKVLDELSDEFGFRELTIKGGDFFLNGRKIRLKFKSSQFRYADLTEQGLDNMLKALKDMHFNGIILESVSERVVKACDRKGIMIALRHVMPPLVRSGTYLPGVPSHGYPFEIYLSPKLAGARQEFEETVTGIVRKLRNSPALVIWAINPLLCWNTEWLNPNLIDADQPQNDILRASFREADFLHSLDPSRLILQSMGGSSGSIISANPYPTFSNNPDEWADWPSRWAARKKKPLLLEEVSLPFSFNYANWYDNVREARSDWNDKKQMFYEQASRYFGDAVYRSASPEQPDNGWNNGRAGIIKEKGVTRNLMDPAMEASADLWLKRCLRAWRIYDISGIWPFEPVADYYASAVEAEKYLPPAQDITVPGAKADFSKECNYDFPTRLYYATKEAQKPFLAFLAGRKNRFSSLEHNYYSGDLVSKQMVFSNDSPDSRKVTAEWEILPPDGKAPDAKGSWSGEIPPGGISKIPLEWKAARVEKRETWQLRFRAKSGSDTCEDSFALHLYPQHVEPTWKNAVLLYDENGKTKSLFKQMKIPFSETLTEASLSTCRLLVVGRESFTTAFLARCRELKINDLLKKGLVMLVLAQNGDGALKEYLEERRARYIFRKDTQHPILQGLSNEDLHHWRNESDMLEPYPNLGMAVTNNRFMRWGMEGTVASFVLDKPFSGRFRVLLDCDADLSRTALLEYFTGKGRIIFCQLDFQPRYGIDPAATLLADQLLSYANAPEPAPTTVPAVLDGNVKATEGLGFDFLPVPELDKSKMLVLTSGFTSSPEMVKDFAQKGGRCLLLGLSLQELQMLGLPNVNSISMQKIRLANRPKNNVLLRGLGNSDFYFNPAVKLPAFENARIVEQIPFGKGDFTVLTVKPEDFKETASQIKVKRIMSTLLSNLGVPAKPSLNFQQEMKDLEFQGKQVPFQIDPNETGIEKNYQTSDFDDSSWRHIKIGAHWEGQGITMKSPRSSAAGLPYDGDAWYRIPVNIPESWRGRTLYFDADLIDDLDWVWFNGYPVGHTGEETPNYWAARRLYRIPEKTINFGGKNVIAIKVRDLRGNGGITGRLRIGGKERESTALFYERPSRLILNFDPNRWRQW